GDAVEDGALGVELLAKLVEVGDLEPGAMPNGALVGCSLAEQEPEQGRLAGAVGPDQTDPVAPHDGGGQARHDGPGAVAGAALLPWDARRAARFGFGPRAPRGADAPPPFAPLGPESLEGADSTFVAGPAGLDALANPRFLGGQLAVEVG